MIGTKGKHAFPEEPSKPTNWLLFYFWDKNIPKVTLKINIFSDELGTGMLSYIFSEISFLFQTNK